MVWNSPFELAMGSPPAAKGVSTHRSERNLNFDQSVTQLAVLEAPASSPAVYCQIYPVSQLITLKVQLGFSPASSWISPSTDSLPKSSRNACLPAGIIPYCLRPSQERFAEAGTPSVNSVIERKSKPRPSIRLAP